MDHIEEVKTRAGDFKKYKKITPKFFKKSTVLAKKIINKKIIHINSTQLGGGVSEMLRSQVPLEQSLGLDSHWFIIKAPIDFFKITKKIHNLLQGEKGRLTTKEKNFYLKWLNGKIALAFKKLIEKEKPDMIVIHDPQPLPLINYIPKEIISVLRIHVDLSEPNPNILKFLKPLILKYKMVILSHSSYRPSWLSAKKSKISMPAIDPFTDKNKTIKKSEAEKIISFYNINTNFPIISQVSRFDPWKDPLGTLQAYYIAKNEIPRLQLILAGLFHAYDDPQAIEVFKRVEKQAKGDPDVFLFSNPKKLKETSNDFFINAVYTASEVVVQKSIKEGFGLTVTEAMWKGKPVIGGKTKGIALQIKHKKNGYLVSNPKEAGEYIAKLLKNQKLRKKIGRSAQETVRKKFLFSRLILDHLKIYNKLLR